MARYVIANRRATKFTAGLLLLLFLESGIKLEELFALKASHFDFSNKYGPEVYIKHIGKKEKNPGN